MAIAWIKACASHVSIFRSYKSSCVAALPLCSAWPQCSQGCPCNLQAKRSTSSPSSKWEPSSAGVSRTDPSQGETPVSEFTCLNQGQLLPWAKLPREFPAFIASTADFSTTGFYCPITLGNSIYQFLCSLPWRFTIYIIVYCKGSD